MTTPSRFISFAQNGEDVILNRVLHGIERGVYVEVGANHPRIESVSRSFYDRGWAGIAVEPNPLFAGLYREERPRDRVIQAAVTDSPEPSLTLHLIEGTGLSTLVDTVSTGHEEHGFSVVDVTVPTVRLDDAIVANGFGDSEIHFLMIDTEGAELQVLRSIDFGKIRPWILIIEATSPGTVIPTHQAWEPLVLQAGYELCLFDGLSRYYVSREKSNELRASLSYPVCIFDDYVSVDKYALEQELVATCALLGEARGQAADLSRQLADVRNSHSWRVTRPLRALRSRFGSQ